MGAREVRIAAGLALLVVGCGEKPTSHRLPIPPFTVLGRLSDPSALSYAIDGSGGPVSERLFATTVRGALDTWSETGLVGFAPVEPGQAPDVSFRWGSDLVPSPFDHDTSVAVASGMPPDARIAFDPDVPWEEADGVGPSLAAVAVHEVGHVLGLGHTTLEGDAMHAQHEFAGDTLGSTDLAALHSLYGAGDAGTGDLRVGAGAPILRRVAPPATTDWSVFDTDGDGDDELIIWCTDGRPGAAFTMYHFSKGPVLERTVGPVLAVAWPSARLEFGLDSKGVRALDVVLPDGSRVRRILNERGLPGEPFEVNGAPRLVNGRDSNDGDLDGDGTRDVVSHEAE